MANASLLDSVSESRSLLERASIPLIYLDYDPSDNIYYLADGGVGYMLCCGVSAGNIETPKSLQILMDALPEGTVCQVILWASPDLTPIVDRWRSHKVTGDKMIDLVVNRHSSFWEGLNYSSASPSMPGCIKNFEMYFTIKLGGKDKVHTVFSLSKDSSRSADELRKRIEILREMRQSILGALAPIGGRFAEPQDLIRFNYSVLNQNHDLRDIPKWDGTSYINDDDFNGTNMSHFCVANDTALKIDSKHIMIDDVYGASLSVKSYPEEWGYTLSTGYMGNILTGMAFKTPVMIVMNAIKITDIEKAKKITSMNIQLSQKSIGRFSQKFRDRMADLSHSMDNIDAHKTLYHMNLCFFVFGKTRSAMDRMISEMKTYYQTLDFRLEQDRDIHLPILLTMLPFGWDPLTKKFMRRGRTVFAENIIGLAPLIADNQGSNPMVLLPTARGQLYNLDLFSNEAGGFNAFTIGTTGAGKSVFLQYLAFNYLMNGDRCFILDIGKSYERFAKTFEGGKINAQFIEIRKDQPKCLNPWTAITNETIFNEFVDFLVDWYYMMGAPADQTLSQEQEKYIKSILMDVMERAWHKKGSSASTDTVYEVMEEVINEGAKSGMGRDGRLSDFLQVLKPYKSTGPYGAFFNGTADIDFTGQLVVLECGSMEDIPALRDPVLMMLMFHISKTIYLGDSKLRYMTIVDEAHKFLGNPKIAQFIIQAYRRFRKHNGSIIMGTQGFEDLSGEAGRIIIDNSQYNFFMKQSAASLQRLLNSTSYNFSEYEGALMQSITPVANEYSEMVIVSGGAVTKVRVMLDPYLKKLFFSTGSLRIKIKEYVEQRGMSYNEAIFQAIADEEAVQC